MPLSDVLDFSQLTGRATVRQGGHGLGTVPADHVLVGTGQDVMRTVRLSDLLGQVGGNGSRQKVRAEDVVGRLTLQNMPASGKDSRYFLASTSDGRGVVWKIPPSADPAPGGGSVSWGEVVGKPSTFPPSAHTHPVGEVTGDWPWSRISDIPPFDNYDFWVLADESDGVEGEHIGSGEQARFVAGARMTVTRTGKTITFVADAPTIATLGEIGDVSFSSPDEGEIIQRGPGSPGDWINRTLEQAGISELGHTHPNATTSVPGFMSGDDKSKLNGIASGADAYGGWEIVHEGVGSGDSVGSGQQVRLIGGSNVTITRTAARELTIAASGGGGDMTFTLQGDTGSELVEDGDTVSIQGSGGISVAVSDGAPGIDVGINLNLGYGDLPSGSGTWDATPTITGALTLTVNSFGLRFLRGDRWVAGITANGDWTARPRDGSWGFINEGIVVTDAPVLVMNGSDSGSAEAGGIRATGASEFTGNLILSNDTAQILSDTSEDSDTKRIILAGGGAASTTRGAMVIVYGADHASQPGLLDMQYRNPGFVRWMQAGTERMRLTDRLLIGTTGDGNAGPGGIRTTGNSDLDGIVRIRRLVLNVSSGMTNYPVSSMPQLYRTDDGSNPFPHNNFGNLVLTARTDGNPRSIVLATGDGTGGGIQNSLSVVPNGNVWIRNKMSVDRGNTQPASGFSLDVGGAIRVRSGTSEFDAITLFADPRWSSDRELKYNIWTIQGEEALGRIRRLRPVEFVWKESDRPSMGFIAQETYAIDERYGSETSVNPMPIISDLLAAVQHLESRLEEALA